MRIYQNNFRDRNRQSMEALNEGTFLAYQKGQVDALYFINHNPGTYEQCDTIGDVIREEAKLTHATNYDSLVQWDHVPFDWQKMVLRRQVTWNYQNMTPGPINPPGKW